MAENSDENDTNHIERDIRSVDLDSLIDESLAKPRRVTTNQIKKKATIRKKEKIRKELKALEEEEDDDDEFPDIKIDRGGRDLQGMIKDYFFQYGSWVSIIFFIIFVISLYFLVKNELQVVAFFITFLVLLAFVVSLGIMSVHNSWKGVLIDKRNKISLGQLQVYIWLFIILSGFIVSSIFNWIHTDTIFTNISIDHLYLIGIIIGSSIGSLFIKNWQHDLLHQNKDPRDAMWGDIFMKELKSDHETPDIGKIQLFLISLFSAIVYFFVMLDLINGADTDKGIEKLPELFTGFVVLLSFSHIGYLVGKFLSTINLDYHPKPPENLRFMILINPDQVELYWDEPIENILKITEYEIYRKIESVDLDFQRIHQLIVAPESELKFNESLPDDNVRIYKIKSRNEVGFSDDSNIVKVKKN